MQLEPAPLFSVIMPAYNRMHHIGASIASVLKQTCTDWECIVVDDRSLDSTVPIVRDIAAGEPRIRLIERKENGGPAAARNQGAAEAKGKYLAFLDSDDIWTPSTLETYRHVLEKAGWPEYLAGQIRPFSQEPEITRWRMGTPRTELFKDAIEACDRGAVSSGVPVTVVKTEAFRRVGGFLEDWLNAEDHDLTLRLGDCRGFVTVREPTTVAYRQHDGQETKSISKTVAGLQRLMDRERSGTYPGGPSRAPARRRIIATHARPACLAALLAGEDRLGWRLYWATFKWQLEARRWRFLVGFPLKGLKSFNFRDLISDRRYRRVVRKFPYQACSRKRSGITAVGTIGGKP